MSRAVLVSADDPFVTLLFFKFFRDVWSDEVDKLYICFNSDVDRRIAEYVGRRVKESPKTVWIYVDHQIGNGEPINRCLDVCREDLVGLIESDGYVYKKGVVDECFSKIEKGECDAVGSPRGSCSMELYRVAMKRFGHPSGFYGDYGPNFWPNFFFVKRRDLLRTDQNFASRRFPKGEHIKELDWTPTDDEQCGDTFVWASIQLRAMGLKFCYVPQCKVYPQHTSINDLPPFGWIHVGSLSSGWTGKFLRGWYPDKLTSTLDYMDRETRVAFWLMAVNLEKYGEIAEFKKRYLDGIEKFIEYYGLNRDRIAEKIRGFKPILYIHKVGNG